MGKDIHTDAVNQLFRAILTLESVEECYTFFEDACTINELLSLSQRFEVAKMLREKKTYLDISRNIQIFQIFANLYHRTKLPILEK